MQANLPPDLILPTPLPALKDKHNHRSEYVSANPRTRLHSRRGNPYGCPDLRIPNIQSRDKGLGQAQGLPLQKPKKSHEQKFS